MTREQTTLRLPPELAEELKREAQGIGITVIELTNIILWAYFEANFQE